jgi:hypothetical protein
MSKCSAIKANGQRCRGRAIDGSQWCWNHNPADAEVRRRNASRGGRRGGSRSLGRSRRTSPSR